MLLFTEFWNTSWKSVHSFAKPVPLLFLSFEILGSRQFSSSTLKYLFFMTSNWALFTGCDCYLSAIELLIQVLYFFKAKKILDSKKMKAVCITWALTSSKSFLSCAFSFLGWSCYWEKYCLIWKVICIWLWLLGFGFR